MSTQLKALGRRLLLNAARHPLLIGLNFVATGTMALGIGAIYWQTGRDTGGIQVCVLHLWHAALLHPLHV